MTAHSEFSVSAEVRSEQCAQLVARTGSVGADVIPHPISGLPSSPGVLTALHTINHSPTTLRASCMNTGEIRSANHLGPIEGHMRSVVAVHHVQYTIGSLSSGLEAGSTPHLCLSDLDIYPPSRCGPDIQGLFDTIIHDGSRDSRRAGCEYIPVRGTWDENRQHAA
jgi:hypothetical protein